MILKLFHFVSLLISYILIRKIYNVLKTTACCFFLSTKKWLYQSFLKTKAYKKLTWIAPGNKFSFLNKIEFFRRLTKEHNHTRWTANWKCYFVNSYVFEKYLTL